MASNCSNSPDKTEREISHRLCYMLEAGGWIKGKTEYRLETLFKEAIYNDKPREIFWRIHTELERENIKSISESQFEKLFKMFQLLKPIVFSTRFYGGSYSDGTYSHMSDSDTMDIIHGVVIVTKAGDISRIPSYATAVFLMEEVGRRPCYPALRLLRINHNHCYVSHLVNIKGVQYLSSLLVKKTFLDEKKQEYGHENIQEHGPCAQHVTPHTNHWMHDELISIPCVSWPPYAMEWINRERTYRIPRRELIKEVTDTACSVVPKCNDTMHELEWRISFLLGERILMWNLSDTQYCCFIFLKHIIKLHLDNQLQEIISSFVMKTILFWEIEETDPNLWENELLLDRIRKCLNRLISCVQKKSLSHYFVRENNLFTSKLCRIDIHKIVKTLKDIIKNTSWFCHKCFNNKCSPTSCMICHNTPLLINTRENGIAGWVKEDYFENRNCSVKLMRDEKLEEFINEFNKLSNDYLTKTFPPYILAYHRGMIANKIGIMCNRKAMENPETSSCRAIYSSLAEQFYKLGGEGANVNGKLFLFAFYYQQRKYGECLKISNLLKDRIYIDNNNIRFIRYEAGAQIDVGDILVGELSDAWEVHNMVFCYEDLLCLPNVLALECALSDRKSGTVQIHGLVYLAFLEFLVFCHCGSEDNTSIAAALDLMSDCSVIACNTEVLSTAKNVLGYCHHMIGNYIYALLFFKKSFSLRPSLRNPCLYYALILIKKHHDSNSHWCLQN